MRGEYRNVYNARILLNTGEAYIAIGNAVEALRVAEFMLSRFPDDQRTSALYFAIAKNWNDPQTYRVAVEVRDRLFPNAGNL